ncbi:MAG: cytochrome c [Rhizobiales bacterium]|nr:cytochrome c [Hyphomicrobiales bacterium]
MILGSGISASRSADNAPIDAVPAGEELEQAALDFMAWCGPCHGTAGKGNGPLAASLTSSPPNLTLLSQNAGGTFPAEEIRLRIDGRDLPAVHGTAEMPVWGYWFNLQATAAGLLQEDQVVAEKEVKDRIARLVEYLKTLQQ